MRQSESAIRAGSHLNYHRTDNLQKLFHRLKYPNKRTTRALIDSLDFDFFELLDSVTIARSRKQIQSFYDMNAIGAFPLMIQT